MSDRPCDSQRPKCDFAASSCRRDARRPKRMPRPLQADYKFYGLTHAGAFATNGFLSLRRNHKLKRSSANATRHVLVYVYKSAPS